VTMLKADTAVSGASITVDVAPGASQPLLGDAGRIQQILVNYVTNALKYAGGRIQLSAAVPAGSPGEIEFAVSDEGAGISEADQATLFTKFTRLAGAQRSERVAHLREYLGFVRANTIDLLQHQIEAATEAPVYWQADVRAIVQANAKALLSKAPPRLGDWAEDLDDNACADALSNELNQMADSLQHWPGLWQYAAEQGEKLLTGL